MYNYLKEKLIGKRPPLEERAEVELAYGVGGKLETPYSNPDILVAQKGLPVFRKMLADPQIAMSIAYQKAAVLASGWTIQVGLGAEELGERVHESLLALDLPLNTIIKGFLDAIVYGYSIAEKIYKIDEDGFVALQNIRAKPPENFSFVVDRFRNILPDGLVNEFSGRKRLPVSKFVIWSYDPQYGNVYGRSILRGAYLSWFAKDQIVRFMNRYMERLSTVPIFAESDPGNEAKMLSVLERLQENTVAVFPRGHLQTIKFMETAKTSRDVFIPVLDYYDRAMARALLVGDRLVASGESGSYAQAEVHFKAFLWIIRELRGEIEGLVNTQIIADYLVYNGLDKKTDVKFVFNPLTEEEKFALASAFGVLVQQGAIAPSESDRAHLRSLLGFPESEAPEASEAPEEPEASEAPEEPKAPEAPEEPGRTSLAEPNAGILGLRPRELSLSEKREDFALASSRLSEIERSAAKSLREFFREQGAAMVPYLVSKYSAGGVTPQFIETGIEFRGADSAKAIIKAFQEIGIEAGADSAKEVLRKAGKAKAFAEPLVTVDPAAYLEARAANIVSQIRGRLIDDLRKVLLRGLRDGLDNVELQEALVNVYASYTAGEITGASVRPLTRANIETLIRTELTDVYNAARTAFFGTVTGLEGYQFSEIIDDRTTELSRDINGKYIRLDNPYINQLQYPLEYNDRGISVPVFQEDLPVEWMSAEEAQEFVRRKGI